MAQQWGGPGGRCRGPGPSSQCRPDTEGEQQRQQCSWQMQLCKLLLTEQIRNYTEDNKCWVSHCQRQYSQRTTRCCVRTEGIIMDPWFYNTHKRYRKIHRLCIYARVCVFVCVYIYVFYPQIRYHFQLQKWKATLELPWVPLASECWQTQKCQSFCNLPKPTKNSTSERHVMRVRNQLSNRRKQNYQLYLPHNTPWSRTL